MAKKRPIETGFVQDHIGNCRKIAIGIQVPQMLVWIYSPHSKLHFFFSFQRYFLYNLQNKGGTRDVQVNISTLGMKDLFKHVVLIDWEIHTRLWESVSIKKRCLYDIFLQSVWSNKHPLGLFCFCLILATINPLVKRRDSGSRQIRIKSWLLYLQAMWPWSCYYISELPSF